MRVDVSRGMAPYRAGHLHFHGRGGVSLAEAVVPALVARLEAARTGKCTFRTEN